MIDFKTIEIQDRPIFQKYILQNNCATCDWTFVDLFCWQHYYKMMWAEVNHWLVIRCRINGERRIGYMVLPESHQQHYSEIVPLLAQETEGQGHLLLLTNLKESECARLHEHLPDRFICDENRDWEDYVYNLSDLQELKGRKYAPKRNHVHKFVANYAYRYETLTPALFDDCIRLENEWRSKHSGNVDDLSAEQQAIRLAFEHYEDLELFGGVLYVNDEIIAFTYGSELNSNTFCTHIEKADIDYDGVFPMINYLFAQHLPSKYTYINREEDMGMDGLRKSKLSYFPARMEKKIVALHLDDDMRQVIKIWKTCFGDEDEFIHSFMVRYYFKDCAFVQRVDNQIVAMSYLIPCNTELGLTAYQYGVATLPEYRQKGLASKLIQSTVDECKKQGFNALFLIPAECDLKGFYGHFGYQDADIAIKFSDSLDLGTGVEDANRAMIVLLNENLSLEQLPQELHCRAIM